MKLASRIAVITGGASGIGRALCRRFHREGAGGLVVADIDEAGARSVASEIGGISVVADVSREEDVVRIANVALAQFGRIDLFCSNAGISFPGGEQVPDRDWEHIWRVNVMAHVWAARAVLPAMLARGEGYLLQTVSAAGLLNQIGSAPYGVTKHAALGFAEWLAIEYGGRGIRVSCLCPQGVRTNMALPDFLREGALEPDQVADAAVRGLETEQFVILPHPEVEEYFRRKASDYNRWLRGMRRLRARVTLSSDNVH